MQCASNRSNRRRSEKGLDEGWGIYRKAITNRTGQTIQLRQVCAVMRRGFAQRSWNAYYYRGSIVTEIGSLSRLKDESVRITGDHPAH